MDSNNFIYRLELYSTGISNISYDVTIPCIITIGNPGEAHSVYT